MRSIPSGLRFARSDYVVSSLCKNITANIIAGGDERDIIRQSLSLLPATVLDRLLLLSPRTWWGMIDCEDKKSFSPFEKSVVIRSIVGLFLPTLILWTMNIVRLGMLRQRRSMATVSTAESLVPMPHMILGRLVVAAMVSPWSFQCIYQIVRQLTIIFRSLRATLQNQSKTLPRAADALKERIKHHRAYRTRRYDVYFPPSLGNFASKRKTKPNENVLQSLLLIPGALVSHEAYSEVAARLSDKGFVVAVMSLEPLRLANQHLGADKKSVLRIMTQITKQIHVHMATLQSYRTDGDGISIKTVEWTLMGHSMGSFAAMKLVDEFFVCSKSDTTSNVGPADSRKATELFVLPEPPSFRVTIRNKLVLWGVAAFIESAIDISNHTDTDILIIQGTNDKLVHMLRTRQAEFDSFFPVNTITKEIEGGTHEGFSSYEAMYGSSPDNNNDKRSLTLDKQHKRTCEFTSQFIRSTGE